MRRALTFWATFLIVWASALPTWAQATDPPPIEVVAAAPTFTDATCDTEASHELPAVEGLDYQYNFDHEAPDDSPRFFVTVEALEGYEISEFEGDFDPEFEHGFDPPIAPGAWVHEYADKPTKPDCKDKDRADEDPAALPSVGAPVAGRTALIAGLTLVIVGLMALWFEPQPRRHGGRHAR